jgi:hypothetical protein
LVMLTVYQSAWVVLAVSIPEASVSGEALLPYLTWQDTSGRRLSTLSLLYTSGEWAFLRLGCGLSRWPSTTH